MAAGGISRPPRSDRGFRAAAFQVRKRQRTVLGHEVCDQVRLDFFSLTGRVSFQQTNI